MQIHHLTRIAAFCLTLTVSCSPARQTVVTVKENDPHPVQEALAGAQVGICIFDPQTGKFLEEKNAGNYFVPASNIKVLTLFSALETLGDSVPGIRYSIENDTVKLLPTGDPSFLNFNFPQSQPVFSFLQQHRTKPMVMSVAGWNEKIYGSGWAWDDYESAFMPERSPFPVYGNVLRWGQQITENEEPMFPGDSLTTLSFSEPEINWSVGFLPSAPDGKFRIHRDRLRNRFLISEGKERSATTFVPFITDTVRSGLELLADSLGASIEITDEWFDRETMQTVFSRPLDSLLRPMMLNSDNFIAEQLMLLMSNEHLNEFSFGKMRDAVTSVLLNEIPDKLQWVDGSGLSRYNMATPRSLVWILNLMQERFGMDRMKQLFATADEGTLTGYYPNYKGRIFAKTGSLSNHTALSGYLYTNHGRLLIFSIMIGNHSASGREVRRAVETYLESWLKK